MNSVLEEIYRTETVADDEGNTREAFPASIQYSDGQALYDVTTKTKANRTLEIGMAFGVSTLFICQAHKDKGSGHHTAIDPWQKRWFNNIGLRNVRNAQLDEDFRFYEAPSFEALAELGKNGERFDFVFIDGNHRFEYTLVDFFLVDKILEVGGYVMLHDPWMPSIRKVLSFILRNRADSFELVPEFGGGQRSMGKMLLKFAGNMRKGWMDPGSALVFARHRFNNYCMLRKTAEFDEEAFGQKWDDYSAF